MKINRSHTLGGSLSDYCIIGGLVVAFGAGAFYVFGLTFQDTVNGTMSPLSSNNIAVSAGNGGSVNNTFVDLDDPSNNGSDTNGSPGTGGHTGLNTGAQGNSDSTSNGGGLTGGGSGQGATGSSSVTGPNNWFGESNNNETAGSNGVSVGSGTNSGGPGGSYFNNSMDFGSVPTDVAGPRSPQTNSGGSSNGGSAGGGSSQGSTISSNDNAVGTADGNTTYNPYGNVDTDLVTGGGYYSPNYNPNTMQFSKVSIQNLESPYLRALYAQGYYGSPSSGYPGYPGYSPQATTPKEASPYSRPSFW
ncbi:MAG: hypothetical protein K2X01_03035 [Cyanobacteria bacterium]|nr:hypothetical protein [Cyanobacteriota bacterium]